MSEYIGKRMSDNEAMNLFPKDYILMKYDSDSIEEMDGEILWVGKDPEGMDNLFNSPNRSGNYRIVMGISFYENSLGSMF